MNKGKKPSLVLHDDSSDDDSMYDIHCPTCATRYLVGSGAIDSFHNTSEGPIAYVRCPEGHRLIRYFRPAATAAVSADPPTVEKVA
jgi:hypothetical protein